MALLKMSVGHLIKVAPPRYPVFAVRYPHACYYNKSFNACHRNCLLHFLTGTIMSLPRVCRVSACYSNQIRLGPSYKTSCVDPTLGEGVAFRYIFKSLCADVATTTLGHAVLAPAPTSDLSPGTPGSEVYSSILPHCVHHLTYPMSSVTWLPRPRLHPTH